MFGTKSTRADLTGKGSDKKVRREEEGKRKGGRGGGGQGGAMTSANQCKTKQNSRMLRLASQRGP